MLDRTSFPTFGARYVTPATTTFRDDALHGKVAVVTGAGGGLGSAIVARLASMGATVVATDLRLPALAEGSNAIPLPCDVTSEASVSALARTIHESLGRCDILVNNAGVLGDSTPLEQLGGEAWDKVFSVNLRGVFVCAKHLVPMMIGAGQGAIVNLASVGARVPNDSGAYAASKAGVLGLTRQMAIAWGTKGVRANSVSPGMIRTPMSEGFYADASVSQAREKAVPLGRVGTPGDISDVVAFLCSDAARYINGQDIIVDGGFLRTALLNVMPPAFAAGRVERPAAT